MSGLPTGPSNVPPSGGPDFTEIVLELHQAADPEETIERTLGYSCSAWEATMPASCSSMRGPARGSRFDQ